MRLQIKFPKPQYTWGAMQMRNLKCKSPINNLTVASDHFELCKSEEDSIYLHMSFWPAEKKVKTLCHESGQLICVTNTTVSRVVPTILLLDLEMARMPQHITYRSHIHNVQVNTGNEFFSCSANMRYELHVRVILRAMFHKFLNCLSTDL